MEIIKNSDEIMPMFSWSEDSMLFSYAEGHIGTGFMEKENNPEWAMICTGDFFFIAGKPCNITDMVEIIKQKGDGVVIIPESEDWFNALNACGFNFQKCMRYILKHPKRFDLSMLEELKYKANKINGAELVMAGQQEYYQLRDCSWENAFVCNFNDCDDFIKNGFGYVLKIDGEIAAAITTFGYYSKGVEIQIATNPKYRQRGFATIIAASFILECVKRGLLPHWDAANPYSIKIAEKMGYSLCGEYLSLC